MSGRSRVAGEYRGVADVLAHFEQRRRSAPAPEELTLVDVIAGTEHVVALAIGSMRVAGAVRRWETVGVFSVRGRDIVQVRVVPFDQHAFDALRGPERGERRQPA